MTVRLVIRWKSTPEGPPARAAKTAAEQRIYQRLPVNYKFSIYPDDQKAGQRSILARGINMSKSGALVELPEPLSVGTVVYIKTNALGLMGTATVRHCTPKGAKFRIGLHFPNPLTRSF